MATQSGKRKLGLPLGLGIFFIIFLIVLATVGTAVALTLFSGQENARRDEVANLVGSLSVQTAFQQGRYRQLQLISRIFSTDPLLASYLAEAAQQRNVAKVFDLVSEYQNILGFDLAMVLDARGLLLARTDDPRAVGADFSQHALVSVALKEEIAFGVWQQGDKLYHAVAVPLVRNFDIVGYVISGFAINDALALQISRTSDVAFTYLAILPENGGPTVVASTLEPGDREALIGALRRQGEAIGRVNRGNTVDGVELSWNGTQYLVALQPLQDADAANVGAAVAVSSLDEKLAGYRQIRWAMLGVGAVALAGGLALALLLARGAQRPARLLADAAERASGGDLETPPPALGGDAGRAAAALGGLLGQLREKRALESFLGHVSRALPEPAKTGAALRPQAQKVALLAIELRRFANPKVGYDAEESLGRFGRDLRRIETAVAARKGHVVALFGHRVLASFDGEASAQRSLAAAAELLHQLSERENVFDEPEPPAVVLTLGNVVTGTVPMAGQSQTAVAGITVQQLESLLREAMPGELYLSKQHFAELVNAFHQAGVEIVPRRGVVSPQPLYVVPLDVAARMTGVELKTSAATGFPGERVSLSDLTAGATIGGRFELLAELGAGRLGTVWKARDRERGDFVALKLLKPEIVADRAQLDRLRTVIRQWRAIAHPNLVAIYDFAEAGGLPYLSSEYVRGMSLRQVLEKSRQVPWLAGLAIARQIFTGLGAAHREKLVHGGLKPEDVLVEPAGKVKLMDFALAPPFNPAALVFLGPPDYLAPEQLEGRPVDARTDLYAAGVILYEMLTGKVPYAAANPHELRLKLLEEDPAPPGRIVELPPALEAVVLRCLAKTPEGRYGSAAEALGELGRVGG